MVSTTIYLNNEKLMKKLRNSKKNVQRFAMEDSVNSAESHGIGKDTSTVEAGMTE